MGSHTKDMEGFKHKAKEVLYQSGPTSTFFEWAEKKTGLDRFLIAGLSVTFLSFWLCLGYGAQLVSGVIGFLYPAYESVKALHRSGRDIEKRWLTYWVVFSFFHILEFFSDHVVWWLPFYWLAKTLFLVWCMVPITNNGSSVIYQKIISPIFINYHGEIDDTMEKAVNKAEILLEKAKGKVLEAAEKIMDKEGNIGSQD